MSGKESKKKKKAFEVLSWQQKKELADVEEEAVKREVDELISWTNMVEAMDDNQLKECVLKRPNSLQSARRGKSASANKRVVQARSPKPRSSASSSSQGLMASVWKFHREDDEDTSVTLQT